MGDADVTRRAALRLTVAAPLVAAAACRPAMTTPAGTTVELAALPEGQRVRVMRGDEPIELLRTGESVRARSLWCTHIGCEVRWIEAHGFYACPCHGGTFDADGRVLQGPPPAPLREIELTRRGGSVVIPPRAPEQAIPPAPRRPTTRTA